MRDFYLLDNVEVIRNREIQKLLLKFVTLQVTYSQRESSAPEKCESQTVPAGRSQAFSVNLNCSVPGTHCVKVRCGPFPLLTNEHGATLDIRADIVTDSINDGLNMFSITSLARVSVPGLDQMLEEFDSYPNEAVFTTQFSPEITTEGVAVWVIIVSVVLSLIVLCLIIVCLVRLNFFESKTKDQKTLLEDQKAEAGFNVPVVDREYRPLMTGEDQTVAL